MKKAVTIAATIAACAAGAADLMFHMDLNTLQMRRGLVTTLLKEVAASGYTHVLWEIEDKVVLDTCPESAHREAFTKDEFQRILAESKALGLKNVPLLQTFGHAEYVLKLEKYRHLRELDGSTDCYCVSKPETRELLRRLIAEYVELFGGKEMGYFHLGGDECYDFCKCPVCSKRNAMELYGEHLNALVGPIRELGVRPCIWNDMLVKPQWEKDVDAVPKDFVVFHWDYYHGNRDNPIKWRDKLQYLVDHGFTCAFAAASACGGDDPFLPGLEFHRRNIDAGWAEVKKRGLAALCVTSWSVRQNSKELQLPLIRYAGTRRWTLGPEYDDLTRWKPDLCGLDGRGWHRYKDSTVPPPGELDRIRKRIDETKTDIWGKALVAGGPTYRRGLVEAALQIKRGVVKALPKVSGRWKEAGELKLRLLDAILAGLRGEKYEAIPFSDTIRYFNAEQTPYSAFNSAEIVWGLYRGSSDDAAKVQREIDEAVRAGRHELVLRGEKRFAKAVKLPSNFTLVLDGALLTMEPNVWENFFVAENAENVKIIGRNGAVLDQGEANDLSEHTHRRNGLPHVRRNSPINFTCVKGLEISGLEIRNQRYWGLVFHYCSDAVVRDVVFKAHHDRQNQDGIDLRNGCHHFTIENVSGQTGDDMIALSAIDWATPEKPSPYFRAELDQDVHDVVIRNVVGAAQNHPLVALRNSNGVKLYNVHVKGVRHTPFGDWCKGAGVPRYALVRIGNLGYYATRPAGPGETKNVVLEDLDTGYALRGVVLAAAVDDLVVRNLRGWGVCRTLVTTDGPKFCGRLGVKAENVTVENAVLASDMPGAKLFDFGKQMEGGYVKNFREVNCSMTHGAVGAPHCTVGAPHCTVGAPHCTVGAPPTGVVTNGMTLVTIPSSYDGTPQSFYMWMPEVTGSGGLASAGRRGADGTVLAGADGTVLAGADGTMTGRVPLLVALHTWSFDFNSASPRDMALAECRKRGWAFVYPNFRGPNKTPKACGSKYAVQDVLDAVEWMKVYCQIDQSRVYAVGGSGGGHMSLMLAAIGQSYVFAGCAAFCPISDLARWHDQNGHYGKMIEAACGGKPKDQPVEYAVRSPLTHLPKAEYLPALYVATGIHDGHRGSVPVGHAIRAFNAVAKPQDRIGEEDVAFIEANEKVPAHLAYHGNDPLYSAKQRIHLRRTSGNVQLTLFEGGHDANYPAAFDFLSRQRWWEPADWTLPASAATADISEVSK